MTNSATNLLVLSIPIKYTKVYRKLKKVYQYSKVNCLLELNSNRNSKYSLIGRTRVKKVEFMASNIII